MSAPAQINQAPYGTLLRQRYSARFFAGQFVSSFGDSLIPVALAFAVLQLTGSVALLGLALALTRLPALVATMVGGVVGDFRSPRRLIIACATVSGLLNVFAGVGMWVLSPGTATTLLVITSMVAAIVAAYAGPAAGRFVRAVFDSPPMLMSAAALQRTIKSVVQVGAYAVSGLLVFLGSPAWAFLLNGATFFFAALMTLLIRRDLPPVERQRADQWVKARRFWNDFTQGWSAVVREKTFALSILAGFFAWLFVIQPYLTIAPAVVSVAYHDGSGLVWGVLGGLFGVGGILGGVLARRISPPQPLIAATALLALDLPLLIVLALDPGSWSIFALSLVSGLQSVLGRIWTTQVLYLKFDETLTSRVFSVTSIAWLSPVVIGSLLAGASALWLTSTEILLAGAGLLVVVLAVIIPIQFVSRDRIH